MSKYLSDCCHEPIEFSNPAPDFIGDKNPEIGTCCCYCSKCGEACNFWVPVRKTWKRNPVTKVQKNKKKAFKEKCSGFEIDEYTE